MRRTLLLLFVALPAFAQDPNTTASALQPLAPVLDRVLAEAQKRADAIRRDTYIHSELVSISRSLLDFQHGVSLQRAIERIEYVRRRITQSKEPAPLSTISLVANVADTLKNARDQGASVNIDEVRSTVQDRGREMQTILFGEVRASLRDRLALSDAASKIAKTSDAVDSATNEALMSMSDFVYDRANR